MPANLLICDFRTDAFKLYPLGQATNAADSQPLEWVYFATLSDLQQHVRLVQGSFPQAVASPAGGPLEVLLSQAVADKIGVQAGESYTCVFYSGVTSGQAPASLTVRIAEIGRPPIPRTNTGTTLPPAAPMRCSCRKTASPPISTRPWITRFSWLPGPGAGRDALQRQPGARPVEAHPGGRAAGQPPLATAQAASFTGRGAQEVPADGNSARFHAVCDQYPHYGALLAFIGLVMSLVVGRQQNEIAVMRSRGATAGRWPALPPCKRWVGPVALLLSAPLGSLVAYLIGKTRTFLDFSVPFMVQLADHRRAVWLGLGMAGLALLAQVAPTLAAAASAL